MKQITIMDDKIYAEAGVLLPYIAQVAYQHGLGGLEWAWGIPGTVGGAVVMNAGAFNYEIFDYITHVDLMNRNGDLVRKEARDIRTTHRFTDINTSEHIIVGANLRLTKKDKQVIMEKVRQYKNYRINTQPSGLTLGSTFKRHFDEKAQKWVSAGYYIDKCNLKGVKIGGAMISEKHANFIINHNDASYTDVLKLMRMMRESVQEQFNIILEPEIKVWLSQSELKLL